MAAIIFILLTIRGCAARKKIEQKLLASRDNYFKRLTNLDRKLWMVTEIYRR
jgi:hypothetical protein